MAQDLDTAERAATADERTTLETFLDYYRDAVTRKVHGVSGEDARRSLVPSATTLAGLLNHLCWVEFSWFEVVLAQTPRSELPRPPWSKDDPDADFRVGPEESVADLIERYQRQCTRSREIAARYELSHTVPNRRLGEVSLRWIYIHMLEETARHAGHADILREQIDGTTGD
ncbi:Protein of unknown function [Haloechinothrix alba]|uniref:DinB superfamily protein n=1 Tax=Haloechinothrix alba TaxID=664784 RepID=A0A238VWB4_9PSEU|nr:DinB family protein [Haloechinothrix alba]SNR38481.1 Protein of unknown function [Haloechinothrix alba]